MRGPFLFLIGVSRLLTVRSQYVLDSCVDSTQPARSAKLNCGNGGRISNVNVRSGVGNCSMTTSERCYGKTARLLTNYLNCYWKSNCVIDWPEEPIIADENGGKCVGLKPSFFQISYRCFQPTTIIEENSQPEYHPNRILIDICNSVHNGVSNYRITGLPYLSGIIRSHPTYPWDYNTLPRTCSVNLYWPANQKLIVTVWDLDLGEHDSLEIFGPHKEILTSGMTVIWPNASSLKTTFTFGVSSDSNSGKGFMTCFLFTDIDDDRTQNACNSITMAGLIENTPTMQESSLKLLELPQQTSASEEEVAIPRKCLRRKTYKSRKRCVARMERRSKGRGGKKRHKRRRDRKTRRRRHRNKNRE